MIIKNEDVNKIAHLARLEFDEKGSEEMAKDMNKILVWMDKLNELDTTDVKPLTHMSAEINVLREDKLDQTLTHAQALKNAPKKDSDYFRVPKVLDISE
jgi:aspartyl-tRNA(Asn)/glutamyl-tRNA(Gln) amidotransferase subunit C